MAATPFAVQGITLMVSDNQYWNFLCTQMSMTNATVDGVIDLMGVDSIDKFEDIEEND